jgi:EipB-like
MMDRDMKIAMVGAAIMVVFHGAATAAPLAPHRAFYDFELGRNDKNSGYSAAQGRLAYEITGSSCEGWSVNYRFASRYIQSEGATQLTDSQLTSWEAGDGTELRLNQKYFVDNALSKESKVIVKRKSPGAAAEGELTVPVPSVFKLAAETLFPATYQAKLLSEASRGSLRDSSIVYEGTDSDKSYRVISVIGKRKDTALTATKPPSTAASSMKNMPAWPITTSYYYAADPDAEQPIYQSHYTMYENGVSVDLNFDYGTYTLKGELTKLELLDADPCN